MAKRILIAGCGDIGAAVGARLVRLGHRVRGLRRTQVRDDSGIDYIQADLTKPETLAVLPSSVDLLLVIVTPSERTPAGYEAIYLKGVANLLHHFAVRGKSIPVIYISSTRVYGQNAGEWVDEDSETVPADEFGRTLLAAEQQVLEQGKGNTIVRFSGIYGRGKPHFLTLLESQQPIQYTPPFYTNRIHRDDCVGALLFLIQKRLAGEFIASHYLITDNEPASKWAVLSWLAKQNGLLEPVWQVLDGANARQGKRCCNARICAAGYVFRYPSYREGYSASLSG